MPAAKPKVEKLPRVTGKDVAAVLRENVEPESTLMTDSSKLYPVVGREFAAHETVDHAADEYVRGEAHTNTVGANSRS